MRILVYGLLAMMLGGCAWLDFSEDPREPTELREFNEVLQVNELWSFDVGAGGDELPSSLVPAVEGGRVYAASRDGRVVALEAASGDVVWQIETDLQLSGGPGVSGSILVVGGLNGRVLALDADTGAELWRAQVSSEVLAVPQIAGSRIVVRSIDGRVFCLSRDDGSRIWVYDSDVPLLTLRGISNPVIRAGQVMVGLDDGSVVALSLDDGALLWERAIAVPEGRTELERLVDIDGNMVVVTTNLYAASYQGSLASLAMESGRVMWNREASTSTGVTAMTGQLFLTDADDVVWAFNRNGGAALWSNDNFRYRKLTAPVPIDDYVVVGDLEGYLHVLAADSGTLVARMRLDDSPIDVMPRSDGGVLYALSRGGELAAYRFGPES